MTQEQDEYEQYKGKIPTYTGWFDPASPTFSIEDIAHGLSLICRYGGQCSCFYSVGEHCLLVAGLMDKLSLGDPLEGLLHDAAEAYVGDVPNPFKHRWQDHLADEHRIDAAIREQFKLPATKSDGCHRADKLALFIESHYLLHDRGAHIPDPLNVRSQAMELRNNGWRIHGFTVRADWYVNGMPPNLIEWQYKKGFQHYGPKIEVANSDVDGEAARAASGEQVAGHALVGPDGGRMG